LQSAWEKKQTSPAFFLYQNALTEGLEKLKKYYSRLDEKPSFVLALGMTLHKLLWRNTNEFIYINYFGVILTNLFTVLHLYYKLAWGGPEEQAAEIAAGNPNVKDWQDKALQIVERAVSCFRF